MNKNTNSLSFEENLKALENLVEKLESQNISLEDSLNHFEKGMALVESCQNQLNQAEKRIKKLAQNHTSSITD